MILSSFIFIFSNVFNLLILKLVFQTQFSVAILFPQNFQLNKYFIQWILSLWGGQNIIRSLLHEHGIWKQSQLFDLIVQWHLAKETGLRTDIFLPRCLTGPWASIPSARMGSVNACLSGPRFSLLTNDPSPLLTVSFFL